MMDWQAQQKAMRDKDRKSKNQTAQVLHGYRSGYTGEQFSLSAIKAQDREKQLQAQQQLHNYRASTEVLSKMAPAKRERRGLGLAGDGGADIVNEAGLSVAELSANFNHQPQQEDQPNSNDQGTSILGGDPSMVVVEQPSAPPNEALTASDEWVSVPDPVTETTRAVETPGLLDPSVAPVEPVVPTPDPTTAAVPAVAPPVEPAPVVAPPAPVAPETSPFTPPVTTPMPVADVPQTVLFSMAVITLDDSPYLPDRYCNAVNQILSGTTLTAPCVVQNCQLDTEYVDTAGRPGCKRFVLSMMVQIPANGDRNAVLDTISASIQSGSMLSVAKPM